MATKKEEKKTEEQEFSRGMTAEDLKAHFERQLQTLCEKAAVTERRIEPELAEPMLWWDIYGLGPFQFGAGMGPIWGPGPLLPHRIIQVGQPAFIATLVILNNAYPTPGGSACDMITNFGAKIQLSYHTCNTQTCSAGGPPELNTKYQIDTKVGQCFYVHVVEFTPTEAACLLETNICARILNCRDAAVYPFAAFVTWIYKFDYDIITPSWQFDRPIRFMVYA